MAALRWNKLDLATLSTQTTPNCDLKFDFERFVWISYSYFRALLLRFYCLKGKETNTTKNGRRPLRRHFRCQGHRPRRQDVRPRWALDRTGMFLVSIFRGIKWFMKFEKRRIHKNPCSWENLVVSFSDSVWCPLSRSFEVVAHTCCDIWIKAACVILIQSNKFSWERFPGRIVALWCDSLMKQTI